MVEAVNFRADDGSRYVRDDKTPRKLPSYAEIQTQGYATVGVYSSAICCEQLITRPCPAFSKTGTGVDAKIGAGVDQETHLCEPIRHIEAAGWIGAVARRH